MELKYSLSELKYYCKEYSFHGFLFVSFSEKVDTNQGLKILAKY